MADKISFTHLDSFKLTGVIVTDQQLGHGSYATVLELKYKGLKCAGKKIHEILLRQGASSYTVRRFEEECRLLSQVRHPNIVQFLGVYVQSQEQIPILVMEFLPTNLTTCIEKHGVLPNEISYSILHDVALGLCYLHGQSPPIIHRDLSSNNVLLTSNMTAKISDLGVARILNLTPLQVSHMTQTPGTPAFMPPEVMVANPKYDTSIDEFSYGILMIHVLSGKWPDPQVGPTRAEHGKLIPVSEAERREIFLQIIGRDHPLMSIILKCIDNDPQQRIHASMIIDGLKKMVVQFPTSLQNQLQMQKYIQISEEDKRALREVAQERAEIIKQKKEEIRNLSKHLQSQLELENNEKERLKLVHSTEVKELQFQVEYLKADLRAVKNKKEAVLTENVTLEYKLSEHLERLSVFDESSKKVKAEFHASLTKERERSERLLLEEKERGEKERQVLRASLEKERNQLMSANTELQVKSAQVIMENEALRSTNLKLEGQAATKEARIKRYDEEIKITEELLEKKDATIAIASEQLMKAREYLAAKKQVSIAWEQCTDLPFATAAGQSTVINGKVYFGGGITDDDNKRYLVHCYSPTENQWMALPPLPVKWFGLGQINGKLVAVGGVKKDKKKRADVYVFDSHKWKSTLIPPMVLARTFPAVSSLSKLLVVASGNMDGGSSTNAVEVFQQATLQWHQAGTLPMACCNLSLANSGDTLYALGGYDQPSLLNQVLYTSVGNLQQPHDPTKPTWRALYTSPTYQPAAAMLSGNLLAVGGWKASKGQVVQKTIHMYSTTTNSWVYFSDLPEPCAWTTCAALSATEVLVIGGRNEEKVKAVYKGRLTVKA